MTIQIFTTIFDNLGMNAISWVNLILFLGVLLFGAKDFKLASITGLAFFTLATVAEYELGYQYQFSLILSLFFLVIMSFQLLFTKQATAGGFY